MELNTFPRKNWSHSVNQRINNNGLVKLSNTTHKKFGFQVKVMENIRKITSLSLYNLKEGNLITSMH